MIANEAKAKKEVQVSMYNHHKKSRRNINSMSPKLFVEMTCYFFRRDDHFH